MTEITYLLILIIIIQIVPIALLFVIMRRLKKPPIGIGLVPSIGGKITREACINLGGSVEDGRCIIQIQQVDKEIITDIGEIYEENNSHI